MIYCSLFYLFSKEEVGLEINDTIFNLPKKVEGELLTIDGDPSNEEDRMFEDIINLYISFLFTKY